MQFWFGNAIAKYLSSMTSHDLFSVFTFLLLSFIPTAPNGYLLSFLSTDFQTDVFNGEQYSFSAFLY